MAINMLVHNINYLPRDNSYDFVGNYNAVIYNYDPIYRSIIIPISQIQ